MSDPPTENSVGSPAGRRATPFVVVMCLFLFLCPPVVSAAELAELEEIIDEARLTFARFTGHPSMTWFRERAQHAHAIFIAPRITRACYLFGGTWGTGVLLVRNPSTGQWSQPAFYRLTGASFGLQIGALNSEIVSLATDDQAAGEMQDGAFTLGLRGQVGFGRMGGGISRSLDMTSGTGYVTVGTASGVFAGIAAGATLVLVKNGANALYYGRPVELSDLLKSRVRNWYSDRLIQTVNNLTAEKGASQP